MGFFENIFGTAKDIVRDGKQVLKSQLSNRTTYERGAPVEQTYTGTFGELPKEQIIPTPQIATSARRLFAGDTPRERLNRIQNERRQSLLPDEARRAVEADAGSEYYVASGGMTPEGGYNPDDVILTGIPMGAAAGRIQKVAKKQLGRLNLRPNEVDIVEQFIDLSRGVKRVDKETAATIRNSAQNIANRLGMEERVATNETLSNAFDRILQNKGEMPIPTTPKKPTEFERSFSKRVREANPELDLPPQMDVRRSTDDLAARADEIIKRGDHQQYIDDIRDAANFSDENIAVASQLLNRYSDELSKTTDATRKSELYESIASVSSDTAAALTEAGRYIQAASILGKVTPEGAVRKAAREVNNYNRKNPTKKIPPITGEQTRFIFEEKKAINSLPMNEERAMREFFLNDYISRLTPSPVGDRISNVWKAGLLTGIKTSGLNIASNTAHNLMEIIKDVPSVGVDIVSSLFTGERTTALTTRGLGSGAQEGMGKGWRYLLTGFDERNIGQKLDYKPLNFGDGKIAKAFEAYTNAVFRTIGSQDQPFYYAAAKHSLWSQALAQGKNQGLRGGDLITFADNLVKNPSEDILRRAVADAQIAVFQNKTQLGALARRIQTTKIAGIPVGQFVVPFAQTPSAVAMQILNYSPVGAVKTIIQNIGRGRFDQRAFSQGIGRSIVGTAPLVIGAEMYKNGLISLDYPSGDEREIELNKAEGRTYNAFRTSQDGDWHSVITLGPAGNLLLFGAYFQKAMDESGSLSEAMSQAGFGALSSFTEQTFMTGFNRFTEFVQDPQRYAATYLPSLAASAIPTIVSDVARANDPVQRNSRGEGFVDSFRTRAMNRIPGARNQLPAQVDALGNVVERGAGPIESMIDPTRPSEDISTPVTQELRRLENAGFSVAPTKIGTSKGYNSLSKEQEQALYETAGSAVRETLEIIMEDPLYQQLSDSDKASLLDKMTKRARNKGTAIYILQLTDGIPVEQQADILLELKEDGLFTSDVRRFYMELLRGE